MDILEKYYPDDDHVFIDDNATTHPKWARDVVSERRMPVNTSKEINRLVPTPSLDESGRQFFATPDGRGLVAIGWAEGVWIGFRHDSRSMRQVLYPRTVSQCAMLEDFGISLVLADKPLFAYRIETLVPSSPRAANASQAPQKLNGNKDVVWVIPDFPGSISPDRGSLPARQRIPSPRTGYWKDKREDAQPPAGSRFGLQSQRSSFLSSDSHELFLKVRVVILCGEGFEITDLSDFKSVTIPQKEDPRLEKLAKTCESCRPMAMFRPNKGTVEWEDTEEWVAWHPPYTLLFDSRFIETRHVETGRLVQITSGNYTRWIWNGRGTNHSQAASEGSRDEIVPQEPGAHGG
ncbi:hypothetical protein BDM02DRAFT_3187748 [Thelephora ganbajun]|uniref:Uncharacterized protein n=1 Tax=Thelephora ganbajun TaxID=370292 RepID=A0ACB6ZET4_THEGA|nr:hypothetical protein BDM02DRAFT_3187748 [Thelephora ganbajun]